MPITGTHLVLHTSEPDALRAVLKDVFGFKHVDAGHGFLIYALPPAEVGIHPTASPEGAHHQLTFMCDDIHATVAELSARGALFKGEPQALPWGIIVIMALPGGCDVMLYQPRHALAIGT